MRHYPAQILICWILDIPPSSIQTHIHFVITTIRSFIQWYLYTIKISNSKHKRLYDIQWCNTTRTITICVDGSEQQIYRPSESTVEEFHYSGKKAKHTLSLLLACSPKGKIYWISDSYAGSLNDQGIYNIPENQLHKFIAPDNGILCDAGFSGIVGHPNFIVALKAPRNGVLTAQQLQYNNNIKIYKNCCGKCVLTIEALGYLQWCIKIYSD